MYPTCYPTSVRKTSLYLSDDDARRLRRLADAEGRSQADVVRSAIAAYERNRGADRAFALSRAWEGDGSSVADVTEERLLQGFGE